MKEYQQRVITEFEELSVNTDALTAFLSTPSFDSLEENEKGRLYAQSFAMMTYRSILQSRITCFEA